MLMYVLEKITKCIKQNIYRRVKMKNKEITNEFLEKERKNYLSNKLNTIARHSLNKSNLIDIVRVGEEISKLTDDFSVKVETHEPVTNQEKSGRCWLFSVENLLRESIAQKYNLESFELSQNFISFYDKLEKANYFIEKMTKEMVSRNYNDRELVDFLKEPITDGGYTSFFVNIIEKYGIVPKSAFNETYQSLNTDKTNEILNNLLRKMYIELRKNKDSSDEICSNIKENTITAVFRILCDIYGVPPTSFDFEYTDKDKKYHIIKNITPIEFYKKYIKIDLSKYHSIINVPMKDKPFNETYTYINAQNVYGAKPGIFLNIELSHFKDLAIKQLKSGEPIIFACDVLKYISNKDGIMSTKAFDFNSLFDIDLSLNKDEELISRNSTANHAMLLTGVNIDENGIPNKWRIENSWGDKNGKKGYYVASDEWFDKFVFELYINDKFLSDDDKQNLEKKPHEVEQWDPIV